MSRLPDASVCAVLRCTGQTAHVVRMGPAEIGMFQTGVCEEHRNAIDAGAPWTYDSLDHVIYMGPDLAAAAHHVVENIRLSHLETLMPDLGEAPIIANFASRTRGSHDRQTISLVFTEEMALALINALGRLVPPDRLLEFWEARVRRVMPE